MSDYDLLDAASISQVRAALDILKESAEAEEFTTFDPSGTGTPQEDANTQGSVNRAQSWNGDDISRSQETDLTSISQPLGALEIGDVSESLQKRPEADGNGCGYNEALEELSAKEKVILLKEMFPTMKDFDISFVLKKYKDNYWTTVEVLLNQVFLEEEQGSEVDSTASKGISGFIETNNSRGRKSGRNKRKQKSLARRSSSTSAPTPDQISSISSRWDKGKEDVEFIAQRTHLSRQTITSMYHKSGASLPSTILALCLTERAESPRTKLDDTVIEIHAHELAQDFPTLSPKQLTSLVHLTHPSTASAHELAIALVSSKTASSTSSPIDLIPQYKPFASADTSSSSASIPGPFNPSLDLHSAAALSATHSQIRSSAFAQASTAHRLSKSRPLMSGAAAYYGQVGRDASAAAKKYAAAAADALVAAQSSSATLDLHGVGVQDAVRIASEKVRAWWEEEGRAEWARKGGKVVGGEGFRIVTGRGRHSEGRKGRLGPAVGRMLVRNGWRMEVEDGEGVLVVRGRARK